MAFENHLNRHREPKGFKVKSNAAARPAQPIASSEPGCREWIAQRKAMREARPLAKLARLFRRRP